MTSAELCTLATVSWVLLYPLVRCFMRCRHNDTTLCMPSHEVHRCNWLRMMFSSRLFLVKACPLTLGSFSLMSAITCLGGSSLSHKKSGTMNQQEVVTNTSVVHPCDAIESIKSTSMETVSTGVLESQYCYISMVLVPSHANGVFHVQITCL